MKKLPPQATAIVGETEYWPLPDLVPTRAITACTGKCVRDDCRLSARYCGGTMMGRQIYYDKAGSLKIYDDNTMIVDVTCLSCSNGWTVKC